MSDVFIAVTPQVEKYIIDATQQFEPTPLRELRERVRALPEGRMQTHLSQARTLGVLAAGCKAQTILEIGTFHGYATAHMALMTQARIVTCDSDVRATSDARDVWTKLGISDRIDLRIAPALETLASLAREEYKFDFVFIDADKKNYSEYFIAALSLCNSGALIAIDNTLWRGEVADIKTKDAHAQAMIACNKLIFETCGACASIIPAWDGLTIVVAS